MSRHSAWLVALALSLFASSAHAASPLDKVLAQENADRKVQATATIDDLAFLRRVTVDIIGRIPTDAEIKQYQTWSTAERRSKVVDKLLKDQGFGDRWTVFMADLLRVRSNADGGSALQAWVHKAVNDGMPYDLMCQQLITASGKANKIPEVGFVLNDQADAMALAAATSQVFMGVRIACAQCHDHPFDVWKREQFYGMAAYFGKLGRQESDLTKAIFTVEKAQTSVKWPPEGVAPEAERKPMEPKFPFELDAKDGQHVMRLVSLRKEQEAAKLAANKKDSIDDLLGGASEKLKNRTNKPKANDVFDVAGEAKQQARDLKVEQDIYRQSELRRELAGLITNPRNRAFSRNIVNRVWNDLLGRGFVMPVDDFSEANTPSHPKTLDYLSDEFVAGGYDLRNLIKLVVMSDAYQRSHLTGVANDVREAAEQAFVAAPVRRMLAETMFDSVVTAGHLFGIKHEPGDNLKTIKQIVRVPVKVERKNAASIAEQLADKKDASAMAMAKPMMVAGGSYDLESAIEIDFSAILKMKDDEPLDAMSAKMSPEAMEANMMLEQRTTRTRYVEQVVEAQIDDNPKYTSAMRMPSPAPPAHFLRVFGQPARDLLGDHRDHSPSMRQALMMLNGKVTHEASRVGKLEPMYKYLAGKTVDLDAAVKLAYREIFTREPQADELADAKAIIADAESPLEGMSDLRWILFNSHEFRFIP
jgi:hypothetical protein